MKLRLFSLVLCSTFLIPSAFSQESSGTGGFTIKIFPERQQERRQSRWSLASWLKTKEKVRQQNQWLWAHTNKIPLEWAIAYGQTPYAWEVEGDVFLARLGLRMTHSRNVSWINDLSDAPAPVGHQTELATQIRLFGGNLQDSLIIARLGYEYSEWNSPSSLSGGAFGSWFVEPILQLYFEQWIGAFASYKYRYTGSHVTRKYQKLSGNVLELAGFLDLGALRFEGAYRTTKDDYSVGGPTLPEHSEWLGRVKLHY
ncbi:hypothetical protein GW916_01110 [bacterium]|nr:hypothetical protein [bacterium]